jgi:hypothetical protein
MDIEVELDRVNTRAIPATVLAPIFAAALFTSAALLFWVQPLIAKMILPLLGGSASVWNTCMVFFQALLLGGYAYALLLSQRLSLKNQAIVHALLLLAAALVLPFALSSRALASVPTQSSPIPWLLTTLLVTVGPPFLLLSATAPLLQRWFSHSTHRAARDPYFLYAVSNAGSMLALLGFPFLLEPAFAIRSQSWIWTVGYAVLVVLVITCAVLLNPRRAATSAAAAVVEQTTVTIESSQRFEWVLLAFVPSSLMLGVTTFIATDVASVPLIWIIPLALYLLTFIIAFGNKQIVKLPVTSILFPVALLALGVFMILEPPVTIWVTITLHLLVFFFAALVSHQRLAQSRPHVSKLPEYYLWIAVGGVLGGIFNALLAPLVFSMPLEYPMAIVLACLVRPITAQENATKSWLRITFPVFIFALTLALSYTIPRFDLPAKMQTGLVLLLPLVLCFAFSFRRPLVFAMAFAAFLLAAIPYSNASVQTVVAMRNFFGVWRVATSPNEPFRRLYHGSTVHGVQLKDDARKCEATSYYHKDGPLGQVFEVNNSKPLRPVAATGLGSGTIGTYSVKGQEWDFYDIDPAIVTIASNPQYFTFLSDCTKGSYRVILGDARLRLREAPAGKYGLLIMDAFSSDSVPAHLLTTEAMDLYLSKMADDGLLAFHISNRYLNLEPLLSGLSHRAGLSAFIRKDGQRTSDGKYPSTWVVMARNDSALGAIASDSRWQRVEGDIVWTDDFSNILSLLK